jgi:hypothetical protein
MLVICQFCDAVSISGTFINIDWVMFVGLWVVHRRRHLWSVAVFAYIGWEHCRRNSNLVPQCTSYLISITKDHSVNAVLGKDIWLWESYGVQKYAAWSDRRGIVKADDVIPLGCKRVRTRTEHCTALLLCCYFHDIHSSKLTKNMFIDCLLYCLLQYFTKNLGIDVFCRKHLTPFYYKMKLKPTWCTLTIKKTLIVD